MVRGKKKRHRQVLKIDYSSTIVDKTSAQEAVGLIMKGKAVSVENRDGEYFYGPPDEYGRRLAIPVPVTIAFNNHGRAPYKREQDEVMAGRMAILNRDNFTCAYCGGYGTTLDHVHPQSKGGGNLWTNLVAACSSCNSAKADMSLAEFTALTGKKLLWEPYVPDSNRYSKEQKMIWDKISRGEIELPEELD